MWGGFFVAETEVKRLLNFGGLGLGLIFEAKDMATGVMRTVEVGLRNVDKTASEMAANYKKAIDSMRGGLAMMGAGAAALAPLIAFGKSAFGVSSMFAQTEKTFAVFTGSLANARKHIADLQVFAEQTPFDFLDLTQYSRQLQAYGFNVERVIPMLKSLGGAAAAMQDPMVLERLARALGQMQAKGKLSGEELRQIAETGVPVYDILQKKLGLTGEQLGKMASQSIDAQKAIGAILEGLDEKYGKMMDEFMKTPQGIVSNIGDMATRIKKTIGDAFYGDITGILQRISKAVSSLGASGVAESFGAGFKNLVALVRPAVDAVMGLVTAFGKLVERQPWIGSFIVTLTGVFGVIMTIAGAVKVATGLAEVARFAFERWGISMQVSMGKVLWPILIVTAALTAYRYALEKNIGGLGTFWRGLGSMISNTRFEPDKGWITSIPESLKKELDKFGLTDFVTKVWMAFVRIKVAAQSFAQDIGKVFQRLDEATRPLRKALGDLGRAILMPFVNLFRSSAESKAKGTIDSWSQMGSNLAASFGKVVPFIQGFSDAVASAMRTLQPVIVPIAHVIAGTMKAVGKVISWVFGLFAGKGEAGETPEARMQRIGKLVGKLVTGFLLVKGAGAGFNLLTSGITGTTNKLYGLADGLQTARARIGGLATGINAFRANGPKAFLALKEAPGKLSKALSELKWGFTAVSIRARELRQGFPRLGQAILGPGGRAGLARLNDGLLKLYIRFSEGAKRAQESVANGLTKLKDGLVRAAQGFASAAKSAWRFAVDLVKSAGNAVKTFAVNGLAKLKDGLENMAKGFVSGAKAAWKFTVSLLTSPVTWIVVGIVALIAALYLLWKNWDKVTAWVKNVWGKFTGWISERTEGIRTAVTGAIQRMVEGVTGWWDNLVLRAKILWNNIKLVWMEGVQGVVDFLARVPVLGNLFKGAQGVVAETVSGIRAELAKLDQASLGAMAIETRSPAASYSPLVPAFAAEGPGFAYAAPAPVFAPPRRPNAAMPPVRPAVAPASAPAQAGGGQPITVRSQLVLDGRVVAESVERVNNENRARSGRW